MGQQAVANADALSLGACELPEVSRGPGAALILLRLPLPPVALVEARQHFVSADPGVGVSLARPGDVVYPTWVVGLEEHAAERVTRRRMVGHAVKEGPQSGQRRLGTLNV